MLHSEFCKIAKCEISYKAYKEAFEPLYMTMDIDKYAFVKMMSSAIKTVAKREMEQERKNQKLIFVSDGTKTPNGCYYNGEFVKLVNVDIPTGKIVVRELTDDEYKTEVAPHFSGYCHSTYDVLVENTILLGA